MNLTRSISQGMPEDITLRSLKFFLPLLALFLINNSILIPKFVLRNRYTMYFSCAALTIAIVWIWQNYIFYDNVHHAPHPELMHHPKPHGFDKPMMPLPVFLDIIFDMLVVGANLAIALMFQHYHDRLEHESLKKANAESELTYLKAQINPHFYMNMLNNIHGMIEIDPEKAQSMVIELSQLMRYMLYDNARHSLLLQQEVDFIKNYINLMRQRYPENKVKITTSLPDDKECRNLEVAPLLFIVFIENAFKHGISYVSASYIDIKLEVKENDIYFNCRNSLRMPNVTESSKGIGLKNVQQRLKLLYGNRANLDITQTPTEYSVTLIIPSNETKHSDS